MVLWAGGFHGFAAPLGANFPAPHGTVCAALLPHVMSANAEALRAQSPEHPALLRYGAIGRTLTGQAGLSVPAAIDAGIEFTAGLARDLDIPPLGQFGLTQGDIPELVNLARKSSSMRHNPVTLSDKALGEILHRGM